MWGDKTNSLVLDIFSYKEGFLILHFSSGITDIYKVPQFYRG